MESLTLRFIILTIAMTGYFFVIRSIIRKEYAPPAASWGPWVIIDGILIYTHFSVNAYLGTIIPLIAFSGASAVFGLSLIDFRKKPLSVDERFVIGVAGLAIMIVLSPASVLESGSSLLGFPELKAEMVRLWASALCLLVAVWPTLKQPKVAVLWPFLFVANSLNLYNVGGSPLDPEKVVILSFWLIATTMTGKKFWIALRP